MPKSPKRPLYVTIDAPITDLAPHPHNPRRITEARFKALVRAVKASPEMLKARPVVALASSGHVIMGNMRLRAARELGWTSIPTFYVDLSEAEAAQWMLRDNNQYGEWDDAGLEEMLAKLHAAGADLDLTGFSEEQVHAILAASGVGEVEIPGVMNEHTDGVTRLCWWPKVAVPISEDDANELTALHAAYLQEHGVNFGFVRRILEAIRESPLLPRLPDRAD
jgi:ParB-like nuclease domain